MEGQIKVPDSLKFKYDFLTLEKVPTGFLESDTSLNLNHVYIPAFRESYKNVYTGNLGTAGFSPLSGRITKGFIDWGINHFKNYQLDALKRNISLKLEPYSKLYYLLGSKQEQRLQVIHQQHITKNMIAGLDFITLASDGFYNDQLAKQRSIDAFYYFNSRNNLYQLLTSYTSNKNESKENGGLVCDTCFENDEGQSVDRGRVNLENAQSLYKAKTYSFRHRLNLVNSQDKTDIDSVSINTTNTSISITNTNIYKRSQFVFEDSDPNLEYYNFIFYDSSTTYDSSFVKELQNSITLTLTQFNKNFSSIEWNVFTDFNHLTLVQNSIDTSISSNIVGSELVYLHNKIFKVNINGKFGLNNSVKKTYTVKGQLDYLLNNKVSFSLIINQSKINPSLVYNLFDSNHFNWKNKFEKPKTLGIKSFIGYKDLIKIGIEHYSYGNYLYFDTLAIPRQHDESINNTQIELEHHIAINKIHHSGKTSYNISSKKDVLPVPDFQLYQSLYFEDKWFKVGLPVQVGFDFRYHTKYFAMSYIPVTGQLYLQNELEIGNYLFADFFFNFRIKNSSVFFKVDHFHEGLLYKKRNYWIMPYHPMMGRSFKIGIKWKFFD